MFIRALIVLYMGINGKLYIVNELMANYMGNYMFRRVFNGNLMGFNGVEND